MKLGGFLNTVELNTQGEGLPVTALTRRAYQWYYPHKGLGLYLTKLRELRAFYNLGVFGVIVFGVLFLLPYILPLQPNGRVADIMISSLLLMMLTGGVALWAGTKIHHLYGAELGRHLATIQRYAPYATTIPEVECHLRSYAHPAPPLMTTDPLVHEAGDFFHLNLEKGESLKDGTGNGPGDE